MESLPGLVAQGEPVFQRDTARVYPSHAHDGLGNILPDPDLQVVKDPYPRNMMVVNGTLEKVLCIDFDRAQIFPPCPRNPRQQGWFEEELEMMEYFANALVSCTLLDALPGRDLDTRRAAAYRPLAEITFQVNNLVSGR